MQSKITLIATAGGLLGLLALAGCGGGNGSGGLDGSGTGSGGGTGGGNGGGTGGGTPPAARSQVIGVWETTNVANGNNTYTQQDRLSRPLINEVIATVANNRHLINNHVTPRSDPLQIKRDIDSFLIYPAGRSEATRKVIEAVLVPDIMRADMSQSGPAYLGVETKGATGGTFGGRKIEDDVVDISLGIIFGKTISALGLAPDDHKEIPTLSKDNVGITTPHSNTFPYLGEPH